MNHVRRLAIPVAAGLMLAPLGMTPALADDDYEVLVVGKTLGFRHSHIDETTEAIIDLGEDHGFTVDVWDPPNNSGGWWGSGSPGQPELTMDSTPFTSAEDLSQYATIIFVSPVDNTNSQDPDVPRLLDDEELAAFQGYIRDGGGFVGIHAATDAMHSVPWWSELTGGGARFRNHPEQQDAVMHVEDPTHPSTEMLPLVWERWDEWYNYTANPRADVHVLITLDEDTYNPGSGAMGEDHPLAWCQNFDGGRSWYEGAGHTDESYSDPLFLEHILGGIEWTAGVAGSAADCITFGEVKELVDDLDTDTGRERAAVRNVSKHLDRAQESADAGNSAKAVRELRVAGVLAGALVRGQDGHVLAEKIADLAEWQREVVTDGR